MGLKNSAGANFRTIQGKSSQSSQSNSKSHMHDAAGNPRKSQQFGNMNPISTISSNNSGIVGGGPPQNFKTLKLRAEQIDGRNKSPSLSKSFNDN